MVDFVKKVCSLVLVTLSMLEIDLEIIYVIINYNTSFVMKGICAYGGGI